MTTFNDDIYSELKELDFEQVKAFDAQVTDGEALPYYDSIQVSRAAVFRNKLSGRVGNYFESYDVDVTLQDKELMSNCSCGHSRKLCVHGISLLYAWVNDGDDFVDVGNKLREIEKMTKDELLKVVLNIVRINPNLIELFLMKNTEDWDELDIDGPDK